MSRFKKFLFNLPEVAPPTQKRLSFKEKLKWTGIILVLFYILGMIPLYGLGANNLAQFEILATILGAQFGFLLSLGIGPIVTASIVLQLLNGSGILHFEMTSTEGRKTFQGVQKLLGFFFVVFEAIIYVFMGAFTPDPTLAAGLFLQMQIVLIVQLILGGVIIIFMADVVERWGFGSGVSLFIAAAVSQQLVIAAFSFITAQGTEAYIGQVWEFFRGLTVDPSISMLALSGILATLFIFAFSVYAQSMKVEIPLSFGRVRGHGIRWPLNFLYTSNIPVILIAALMANLQVWGSVLQNWGWPILGSFVDGRATSGIAVWFSPINILQEIINGGFSGFLNALPHAAFYVLIMIVGSTVFSYFWVQTSGMDAKSQAKQMMSSGLQIPGFRRDIRVLERLLQRYITPLTILGGIAIGLLAGLADVSGTLANGTGLLLTVMIVYKLYEEIAKQHMMDMNPALRKMMGGE